MLACCFLLFSSHSLYGLLKSNSIGACIGDVITSCVCKCFCHITTKIFALRSRFLLVANDA